MATVDATVNIVLERLRSSTDSNDKLEAIEALVELSETSPIEVGNGIPILMETLKACSNNNLESDAASQILEILENLVTGDIDSKRISAAANTARLVDSHENIVVLFDILETAEVSTACSAVEVLRLLHHNSATSLEATVLECPVGMQRLLDILAPHYDGDKFSEDEREPLRNVTLVLWEQLTASNQDMRLFLALQEGFDHLSAIMYSEKDSGPITRDCLAITLNVASLPSTQSLLTQSSLLGHFENILKFDFQEESIVPYSYVEKQRKEKSSMKTKSNKKEGESGATSSGMWSDDEDDDDDTTVNGDDDEGSDEEVRRRRSSYSNQISLDICWMKPLLPNQLQCCDLAFAILLKLVTLYEQDKKDEENKKKLNSNNEDDDDEVKKILLLREMADKTKHREVIYKTLGSLLIQLSLPPPPPPYSFIGFTPTNLWILSLNILKELCNDLSNVCHILLSEPHVLANLLPKLIPMNMINDDGSTMVVPLTPGNHQQLSSSTSLAVVEEVPLTALGCAIRWLLLGYENTKHCMVSSALSCTFGGPQKVMKFLTKRNKMLEQNKEKLQNEFLNSPDYVLFQNILEEANQGTTDMLKGMFELVQSCLKDETICMMAVNSAVMTDMTMMFSPMHFDDDEIEGSPSAPSSQPQPFVKMLLQSLSLSVDSCLYSNDEEDEEEEEDDDDEENEIKHKDWKIFGDNLLMDTSHHICSHSGAAAARLLRVVLSNGGEGASQLALRAQVQLRDHDNLSLINEQLLLPSTLYWIENLVSKIQENIEIYNEINITKHKNKKKNFNKNKSLLEDDNKNIFKSQKLILKILDSIEMVISLLSFLTIWVQDCPLVVTQLLENPENLFLIELASSSTLFPKISFNAKNFNHHHQNNNVLKLISKIENDIKKMNMILPSVQSLSIFVLGIMLKEIMNGEEKIKLEMIMKKEKQINHLKNTLKLRNDMKDETEDKNKEDEEMIKALEEEKALLLSKHALTNQSTNDSGSTVWNSEMLQRCIVGRVGFGPFQRSLTSLSKSFLSANQASSSQQQQYLSAICGEEFCQFLEIGIPAVQSSLVSAYRGGGGGGGLNQLDESEITDEFSSSNSTLIQAQSDELEKLKAFIQSKGLEIPTSSESASIEVHVIHAIGPDLRKTHKVPKRAISNGGDNTMVIPEEIEEIDQLFSAEEAIAALVNAYHNIFIEFSKSGASILRMLPVSGGIFSGSFKKQIPSFTKESIYKGFNLLSIHEKQMIVDKQFDLCIFCENELSSFYEVGFELREQNDINMKGIQQDSKKKNNEKEEVENNQNNLSKTSTLSVKLQPYGVLGQQLDMEGRIVQLGIDPLLVKGCCIVDPAGLHHIQPPGGPSGAGGASGAIYQWLNIHHEENFTLDIINGMKYTGDAKYHMYLLENVKNKEENNDDNDKKLIKIDQDEMIKKLKNENEGLILKNSNFENQIKNFEKQVIELKEELSHCKDSKKAIQIAKELGKQEGYKECEIKYLNVENNSTNERIEKYRQRAKDCEELVLQSSKAASLASAAWQSQKAEMESNWESDRQDLKSRLLEAQNATQLLEANFKEEKELLKQTMNELQEKLIEKESDGIDHKQATRTALEQAAKHQEELERAVQLQVSASADALQGEAEALNMYEKVAAELGQVKSEAGALRGMMAEKDNDLLEATQRAEMLSQELSESENQVRSLEEVLKERSQALDDRIAAGTSSELQRESLGQEVRSVVEERDSLRNKLMEVENNLLDMIQEKELSNVAFIELENEIEKQRDVLSSSRKQHNNELKIIRSEKNDLNNKIVDLESEINILNEKLQNQSQANEALKQANESEYNQLTSTHQLQVLELKTELSQVQQALTKVTAFQEGTANGQSLDSSSSSSVDHDEGSLIEEREGSQSRRVESPGALGIVGKEVASKEALLKLQALHDTAVEQRNNTIERSTRLEMEATEERRSFVMREEALKIKLSDLKSELESMAKKHKVETANWLEENQRKEEDFQADLDSVSSATNAEKLKVKALRRELESSNSSYENKLSLIKGKHETELAKWKGRVSEIEDEIVKLRGNTSEELMAMKTDHSSSVRMLEEDQRMALEHLESEHQSEVLELRSSKTELQNKLINLEIEKENIFEKNMILEKEYQELEEQMALKYGEEIGKLKVELMKITSEANSSTDQSRKELSNVLKNHSNLNQSHQLEIQTQKEYYENLIIKNDLNFKNEKMNILNEIKNEINKIEKKYNDMLLKNENDNKIKLNNEINLIKNECLNEKLKLENKFKTEIEDYKRAVAQLETQLTNEKENARNAENTANKSVATISELSEKLRQLEMSHTRFKERANAEVFGRDEATEQLAEATAKAEAEIQILNNENEKLNKLLSSLQNKEKKYLENIQNLKNKSVENNENNENLDKNNEKLIEKIKKEENEKFEKKLQQIEKSNLLLLENKIKENYDIGYQNGEKIGNENGFENGYQNGEKNGLIKGKLILNEENDIKLKLNYKKDMEKTIEQLNQSYEQSLLDMKLELKKAHELVVTELESDISSLHRELSALKHTNHLSEAKKAMTPQSKQRSVNFKDNEGDKEEEEEEEDDFQMKSNRSMLNASPYTPMNGGGGGGRRRRQHHVATPDLRSGLNDERAMYRELEEEHEDLLSLLAQQEVEKDAIIHALLSVHDGEKQYMNAKQQAEKQCIERFGVYVPNYNANSDEEEEDDDVDDVGNTDKVGNMSSPNDLNDISFEREGGISQHELSTLMSPLQRNSNSSTSVNLSPKNSEHLFGDVDDETNYEEFEDDLKDL